MRARGLRAFGRVPRGIARVAAGLAFVAALGAGVLRAGSEEGEKPPVSPAASLMNDLSQSFRLLETKLMTGDREAAVMLADELGSHAPRLAGLKPETNVSLGDEFGRQVTRLVDLVDETRTLAEQGRLGGASQAFEELRATCVSCHLTFRSNNAARGNFPARDNTVGGAVELLDADGASRESRAWVLVFLEGGPGFAPVVNARGNPRVSQSGRRFEPRLLPVVVGTEVEFPNDDTIFHNVFSLSKTAPFDLGVYEPGHSSSVRMEQTGLVKVYCNIHPEMAASIVVLANPWYALTDRAGNYVICGVPDGEYVLRAWNDMGAEAREPILVAGNVVLEKRIVLRETRRALQHSNKYGKPYAGKYK